MIVVLCAASFSILVLGRKQFPIMAADTGPPKGTVPYMTPFPMAGDPSPPRPIPDVLHPEKTLAERALARFSLSGKHAVGECSLFARDLFNQRLER